MARDIKVTKLGAHGTPFPDLTGSSVAAPPGTVTQIGQETAWQGTPTAYATQIGAEPMWQGAPVAHVTQIGIEILIPFECPTRIPSCPRMPNACPVPAPVAASGISCVVPGPSAQTGSCVIIVPDPLCPQD